MILPERVSDILSRKALIVGNTTQVGLIETILLHALAPYKLPLETQDPVGPYIVDIALPEELVAIECDGEEFHSSDEAIVRDRRKDTYLKKQGWKIERFDGWFLNKHADVAAAKIALRYCNAKLERSLKRHAIGVLAGYFMEKDPKLGKAIMKQYQGEVMHPCI